MSKESLNKNTNETKLEKAKRLAITAFFVGCVAVSSVFAVDGAVELATGGDGFLPAPEDVSAELVEYTDSTKADELGQIVIGGLMAAGYGTMIVIVNTRRKEQETESVKHS